MKKKIFALLLALCVALTMMPAMALAENTGTLYFLKADPTPGDNGQWSSNNYSSTLELAKGESCQGVLGIMLEGQQTNGSNSKNFSSVAANANIAVSDSNEIPCKTLPTGSSYESFEKLLESGCLLGDVDPYQETIGPKNTNLTRHINMSLAPGADENSFYVLHPEGTTLTQESYQQFLYMENGGHEYIIDPIRDGNERDRRSRGSIKLDDIYTITPVETDNGAFEITCKVGENLNETLTLVASKVTLKGNTYHGHNNIYSKFSATRDDTVSVNDYAVVCLAKGMDITIEGATDAVEYINGDLEFSGWAMNMTPSSELIWNDNDDECPLVSKLGFAFGLSTALPATHLRNCLEGVETKLRKRDSAGAHRICGSEDARPEQFMSSKPLQKRKMQRLAK